MIAPGDDAAVGAVFAALADPTRRRIVRLLGEHASAGVTTSALAGQLPVTRQAVAKHLATLRDAGLAQGEPAGRETRYRLTPGPMTDAVGWMTETGSRWDERLARLGRELQA